MSATSKSQYRFMQGVKSGSIKSPGLTPQKAAEFIAATPNPSSLPEKVSKQKTRKIKRGKKIHQHIF